MSRTGALLVTLACFAAASPCAFSGEGDALVDALRARFPEVVRFEATPVSPLRAKDAEIEIPADLALEKRIQTWVTTKGARAAHRCRLFAMPRSSSEACTTFAFSS